MYPSYMNKPTFMTNTANTGFGASTSSFGQPSANTSMFSSMQPSNIFQTPSTSSFNAGPSTQSSFGTNLFGQQPQPSTSGLFGTSNAFGQNKTTFGFGSTPAQTGLFGQQPQQQAGTSLFQSNSSNLFGSSTFGNQTTGTVIKFQPVTGTDTMQKNGVTTSISTKHHSITCMKEYESKSFEELRFEDYSCNRKGPQQQTGFGAAPFGASTSGSSTSLFGQTDNKQGFGQPQAFGQTPAFGQTTPAFGVTNQTNTPNLFGKPNTFGATTSTTPAFGFNQTQSTSNPFSATQTQKPFSQPLFGTTTTQAQPSFGTGVFGQTNTQPVQPTTGFNTGQQGFSFNQAGTTQASNLFQVSKPNTGFGIFGQTNTTPAFGQTSQPTFGTNFGKLTQPTFTQPTQPAFGTNLTGGLQQPSLFGSTASKPPSLFGSTNTGGSLFNNNVFQQTPTSFSLNMNQQQPLQFPPEPSDESKNISLIATDSFPDGPHVYGLEPVLTDSSNSTTNPKDIKLLLDYSKKRDEMLGTKAKIKVQMPKPKRGNNYNKEFFETNQTLKGSHKCLVIRKFNDNNNSIYNKYKNELLEEAEECMKAASEADSSSIISPRSNISDAGTYGETLSEYKGRIMNLRLQFDTTATEDTDDTRTVDDSVFSPSAVSSKSNILSESRSSKSLPPSQVSSNMTLIDDDPAGAETDTEPPSVTTTNEPEIIENAAGVILSKPEYYMYPALKDLQQYMDDNGECVVQGLTIGRRGYGNVYFPDPIDISNMNFDEIVHFRHREVIIYPDDTKKPQVGEGINRRAQVTLDKIYPREKGTNNYITDVNQILQTNFVDNLMHVTQKHNCKFVDYRPKTGSWVFKVKHFSKYAFTDSDEEECEVGGEKAIAKKAADLLKKIEEVEEMPFGLGGGLQVMKNQTLLKDVDSFVTDPTMLDYWQEDHYMLTEEMYHTESAIQTLKSSLFTNLDKIKEKKQPESVVVETRQLVPSEVVVSPTMYKLPDISLIVHPEKVTSTQRCYTELAIFKCNNYKIGWGKGFNFYNSDPIADSEVIYTLNHCNMNVDAPGHYNSMMPNLTDMLKVTLAESDFTFDNDKVPTLHIRKDLSYLQKQTNLFNDHVRHQTLTGRDKYLCSVWNLCSALWGPGDNSSCSRRQYVSDWLKKFSYDLSDEWSIDEHLEMQESETFKTIFKLLSFYKIPEACEFASKNNLHRLSLLISQMSANDRDKYWMEKFLDGFVWKERGVIVDDFKKLYLLLAGIPTRETINTCDDLNWMRSFGLHLWYIAPAAAPIDVAFNLYKKAFVESEYACKPIPPYCESQSQTSQFDLLYHILALYVDGTYQLCNVLHPETHTENAMDYRLSWFILQLFLSLEAGLIRDSEKEHLHTTFSTQLENMGLWKWAIFALLFLENNTVKKYLITRILDRNLATFAETAQVEKELVQTFHIPPAWIHEVKATKSKVGGHYYDYFQHYVYMEDWQNASSAFVSHILPELFVNEQYDYLTFFLNKLEPISNVLINWQTQGGLIKEFLDLQDNLSQGSDDGISYIAGKLSSLFRRISSFPLKNDQQKLCVAELSRKCALLFKLIHKTLDSQEFQAKFIDVLSNLVMPPDIKHYEIFYLISKYIQESDA
ncbi:nuclear pore complex protein Nup98-Nup96-like isoform X2 [Zophobas morio]|uniref:nuclear pore complex protein Nup98-Nup96-like isoform X2 n=1 Tax=Zophobas morio TaxID=2755281 RepID=UPI003082E509